jgi:hypothetical protein
MTSKNAEWQWEAPQQEAFSTLRRCLTEQPVLMHPDFEREFIVQTDYSKTALGAVLSQRGPDGFEHPIAFLSKKCRGQECHYSARRGEAVAIRHALRKWRCFLEGQHFIIETDHRPLEFLRKETDDAQLCRIWEAMEPFNYTIRYKKGSTNANADALSRSEQYYHETGDPVCEATASGFTREDVSDEESCPEARVNNVTADNASLPLDSEEELHKRQRDDPLLAELIEQLEQGVTPTARWARGAALDREGILIRLRTQTNDRLPHIQVFIPESDRDQHLKQSHDQSGHFGIKRTLQTLRREAFWPNMAADVENYVTTCLSCQQNQATVPSKQGLMNMFDEDLATEPWTVIHIDHVTALPTTTRGNKHILTATCRLTHGTIFIPVKTLTAAEAADALTDQVLLVRGFPLKIVADRSSSWCNALWEAMSEAFGFRLALTVARRAQGNGMAERPHRYLNKYLRTLSESDQHRWDRRLNYLAFVYGSGVNATTRETPHYLEFGRDLRGPRRYSIRIPQEASKEQKTYLKDLHSRLRSAWTTAGVIAANAYRQRIDRANVGRSDLPLTPGELVWVTRVVSEPVMEERQSRRLLPRLTGPWRVLHRHDNAPGTYRLQLVGTSQEASFNIEQIIPYRSREPQQTSDDDDDDDEDPGSSPDTRSDPQHSSESDDDSDGFEPYHSADFDSSDDDSVPDDPSYQGSESCEAARPHSRTSRRSVHFAKDLA